MKYEIKLSYARYEKGILVECRFMVKNKQGEVLYHCNSLKSAQKEVERLLKEDKCKSKNNKKNKRIKNNEQNLSKI